MDQDASLKYAREIPANNPIFDTPSFVINIEALENNLKKLKLVQDRTGAKILLALKGFSMFPVAKLISRYLSGTTASGLHELKLGFEEFGGLSHVYSPAYDSRSFPEIVKMADHIVFNTPQQYQQFKGYLLQNSATLCGIRVNPGYSEVKVPLYNPCYKNSRLGTTIEEFDESLLQGITGLHFHTMCEQGAETLVRTLEHVEKNFGSFIKKQCQWVNFGGGHHITQDDYNFDLLCQTIAAFKERYSVEVYLEPGEAIAINTGVLLVKVLDVMKNGIPIALLDTSATTHMPDVLEMPYRPTILGGAEPSTKAHTYRLTGMTCLAGDVIGDYSFDAPMRPGDVLVFCDMGHYSMVKTTTFNGVPLPSICTYDPRTGEAKVCRKFGYGDFKNRLG